MSQLLRVLTCDFSGPHNNIQSKLAFTIAVTLLVLLDHYLKVIMLLSPLHLDVHIHWGSDCVSEPIQEAGHLQRGVHIRIHG